MVRRWRMIAQLGLLGALILVFPSGGSALSAAFVALTPSGPSPIVLTIPAGMHPVWNNNDQVPHTVVFANGLCSFQLAPGTYGQCNFEFSAGRYPYTVDGTTQASVVVNALPPPTVTLTARSHTIRRAAHLRLHGRLNSSECCLPPPLITHTRVIVLARRDRHHPFRPIATAPSGKREPEGGYPWRLDLHPKTKTIYIAEVTYQPGGEQGLQRSWSSPFKVSVSAQG